MLFISECLTMNSTQRVECRDSSPKDIAKRHAMVLSDATNKSYFKFRITNENTGNSSYVEVNVKKVFTCKVHDVE